MTPTMGAMSQQVGVLTVCTANICRSPAAAVLLQRGLRQRVPDLAVASAGVAATPGHSACEVSAALVGGRELAAHRSRRIGSRDVAGADLILALDRSHRSAVAQLSPASRTRTFTLRQAAAAAAEVAQTLRSGRLPDGAPPLPQDAAERFRWWVGELDAARSAPPQDAAHSLAFDALDVPDPHVVGYQFHPMAVELITAAVVEVVESFTAVLAAR